ncbi:MAG: divalent-cation tolerance protein CutA [Dehalococcoidia bacterium]
MNDEVVMITTAPEVAAAAIARALVEQRLAACVNILPAVQSVYRWQGAVEEASEALVVIKTLRSRFEAVDAALRELHPYEVYELLALPVEAGNAAYLGWMRESVS